MTQCSFGGHVKDDFEDKLDKAVNNYEKNAEKVADKAGKVMDVVGRGANRVFIGCSTIFANLFFSAFCLWGAYAASVSWRLETSGESTTGRVTRLEESETPEGYCCVYSPVVEFEVNGQTYSFEDDTASSSPDYDIGNEVRILYDPEDPNTAQINQFSKRWLFPIIIIPAMIFAALLVNFFMIRAWRRGEDVLGDALA
jgi:hypothetical protein